jgi:hypothetical protein
LPVLLSAEEAYCEEEDDDDDDEDAAAELSWPCSLSGVPSLPSKCNVFFFGFRALPPL